jgi:iron complex transport system substrate-binding protein
MIRATSLVRALAAGVAVIAAVGACSAGTAPAPPPAATAVQHKYGTTEVPAEPRRIVTVGLTDQDAALALGTKPVGTIDWYGDYPAGVWPWQQEKFGAELPTVVGDASTINFEAIAALRPDLILGVYSGLTQADYDKLAKIAPTVAQPVGFADYLAPWQDQTRLIGKALGQAEQADALVADVEAKFAAAKAAHPEFAGRTVAATAFNEPGSYGIYETDDAKNRFFASLGFVVPEPVKQLTASGYGSISAERFDLLEVDLLVWFTSTTPELIPELEASPGYQRLSVHREGRDIFLGPQDKVLNGAISWSTVLSLPIAIDEMVPRIPLALDRDPATTP